MASTAALDLIIQLKGDKAATKGLSNMARESGGLNKAFGTLAKVGLGAVIGGVGLMAGGFAKAMGEASEWEGHMAQLNAVLKSTGGAAGLTADEVVNLSQKLSASNGLSKFSDDAVLAGNNLLLTFTKIGKDVFPQASQAAVDMAQALGGDPVDQAKLLGKALNDPERGLTALTRAGVVFSEEQRKVIKEMVATGDIAGAQKIILGELATEFGGSAAAAAGTFSGKMITLQEKLNDVFEAVGTKLLPVITGFVDFLSKPETMAGIQAFAEGLITGIGEAAKIVGPIIQGIADNVGKFFTAVSSGDPEKVSAFWNDIGGPIGFVGNALTVVATEVGKFFGAIASGDPEKIKAFWNDIGGPIGFVGQTLTDAATKANEFFTALFQDTSASTEAVKVHSEAWNDLYARNGVAEKATESFWDGFWREQGEGLSELDRLYKESAALRTQNEENFAKLWDTFWTNTKTHFDKFGKDWDAFWQNAKTNKESDNTRWDEFWGQTKIHFDAFGMKWDAFWLITKTQFDAFGKGWDGFWAGVATALQAFNNAWVILWSAIGTDLQGVKEKFNTFFFDIGAALRGIIKGAADIGSDIVKGIWAGISAGWGWLTSMVQKAAQQLLQAAKDALGIKSPSRDFANEVGKPMAQGILMGFSQEWSAAQRSIASMVAGASGGVTIPSVPSAGIGSGLGSIGAGLGGGVSTRPQIIQLTVDGKVLAEVLSPNIETRRSLRNAYSSGAV